MTRTNRIRILLGTLAVAIGAAILLWPGPEAPPATQAVVPPPAPVAAKVQTSAGPLSDSAYAERLKEPGVLLASSDTTASFYWATMLDSTASPGDYGLLRAADLVDSTFRVDMLGSDGNVTHTSLGDRARIETDLRRPSEGCQIALDVPLAERVEPQSWVIAFRPGAATVVPGALTPVLDSAIDLEAQRLVALVPMDSTPMGEGLPTPDKVFAYLPLRPQTSRFVVGSDEFLLIEAWRSRKLDTLVNGQAAHLELSEQRLIVAERKVGSAAPFAVSWTRYAAFEADQARSEAPLMLVRVGKKRLPAIVFSGQFRDGGGGSLLARVAPGRWAEVASWYTGC
jgi:hypothetical protein